MKKVLSQLVIILLTVYFSALANAETVWIDVRTAIEHSIDSIEGDARISHEDIVEGVKNTYPDKSTEIHLYCRSGGRAAKAMSLLKNAGYTRVFNAGSIDDARAQRGIAH